MVKYRDADKSLARPGREQATSTKIYLLQTTQKQFRKLSVQPGLPESNDLRVGRKMATFQLFFFWSGRAKELSAPLYQGRGGWGINTVGETRRAYRITKL